VTDPQRALALKERELQLLLAVDAIRDADDEDPQRMFDAINDLLASTFQADGCAIALLAETNDDIEWLAFKGMSEDAAITLCRAALTRESPAPLNVEGWPFTLGNQLTLKRLPLGGLVLTRQEQPFTQDEISLLMIGEKQIDSAIVQAHTYWKLAQRTRELEAIYLIDRLRDEIESESALLHALTSVLIEQFDADIAVIMLNEGEWTAVAMADPFEVPEESLRALRYAASDLHFPQVIPTPPGLAAADRRRVMLAAPLMIGSERLGAVAIGRCGVCTVDDHRLLYAITTQMDSALHHMRLQMRLAALEGKKLQA
jgi:GAF domain-containing protein